MSGLPLVLKVTAALTTLVLGAGGAVWLLHVGHVLMNGPTPTPVDPHCADTKNNPYAFLCEEALHDGLGIAVYDGQTVFFDSRRDLYYLERPVKIGSGWTRQVFDEIPFDRLPADFQVIKSPPERP